MNNNKQILNYCKNYYKIIDFNFNEEDFITEKLIKIYNMTKARNDKQKNHQEICVIFSILKNWLQANIKDAVQTSKEFLREQSIKYKNNKDENLENLKIYKQNVGEKFYKST